jgi:hypothetical protein
MKGMVYRTAVLIAAMAIVFGSINVFADEEPKPTASADVSVLSKYIWRGYELSDGSAVIQPSMTVEYKGYSMNMWGNLDTAFDDGDPLTKDDAQFNETDLTLAYDTHMGGFDVGVGYIYYGLDGIDDAQEFYVSLGPSECPLGPTLTVYREIADAQGWYVNLGISHSIELKHEITLDLGASAGYYYSEDDSFVEVDDNLNPTTEKYKNFHEGLISAGLTIPLDAYFTLSPKLAYSFPLGDKANDLITSRSISHDSDFLFGGATVSLAF